jgi:hypothetical protein
MSPVTAESSQPAPQPAAPQSTGSSASNQSVRIAALVVVGLIIVGVVLYLILSHNSTKKHHKGKGGGSAAALVTRIAPVLKTQKQLIAMGPALAQPVYWAGPQTGHRAEFTRLPNDRIYIRYLPKGTAAGSNETVPNYLVVSTYPFPQAYKRLKKGTHESGTIAPSGAYVWQRKSDPRSVLIAWQNVPYEVEVFDPSSTLSKHLALSGAIKPVG